VHHLNAGNLKLFSFYEIIKSITVLKSPQITDLSHFLLLVADSVCVECCESGTDPVRPHKKIGKNVYRMNLLARFIET
jgi:hypothetical protein